ncbi:hypothetical protein EG850_05880 [Gulosibacter macacae]|uniref:DNA helicase n=1 Tax=Gulosibacter macacae TaxID=2488791 RepID=A0A3P3VZT1_9MICO|nr:hypothetical protein [Gulosibacter macacae]RRJ86939.1 hypothetical protein EG850_05880 [Gulosibacter macacae]
MALSRKNKRKLNRLRNDADRLWSEQQVVIAKARELAGRAGEGARIYAESEVVPNVRKAYDDNLRPAVEGGIARGRDVVHTAERSLSKNVIPALAAVGGGVAGVVRELSDKNAKAVHLLQERADGFSKDASKRLTEIGRRFDLVPEPPKKKGPGVGGWFLIGAGVAAIAAVGYALWQTFRADDDLWIADEELDAPVETVEPTTR